MQRLMERELQQASETVIIYKFIVYIDQNEFLAVTAKATQFL